MHSRMWYWLPVFVYACFIFYMSSLTRLSWILEGERSFGFHTSAVFKHGVEYSILGLLLFRAFKNTFSGSPKSLVSSGLVGSFYGLTDEIHQFFVPYRLCTFEDVIADMIGVFFGGLLALFLYRLTDSLATDLSQIHWMKPNLSVRLRDLFFRNNK